MFFKPLSYLVFQEHFALNIFGGLDDLQDLFKRSHLCPSFQDWRKKIVVVRVPVVPVAKWKMAAAISAYHLFYQEKYPAMVLADRADK
jgi:hypothetical protein